MINLNSNDWVVLTHNSSCICGRVLYAFYNEKGKIVEVTVNGMDGERYICDTQKELNGIRQMAKVDGVATMKLILK